MTTMSEYGKSRRQVLKATGVTALGLSIAGCAGDNGDGEYPDDNIEFIIGVSEGGGMDRAVREIQPYFEERIGTNLEIEYIQGASQLIAMNETLQAEPDGYTIMGTNAPLMQFHEAMEDVNPHSEFTRIGNTTNEPGLIRIHEDEDRFDDLEGMVEYGQENPGELTFSMAAAYDRNALAMLLLMRETGAEFTPVPYDGGGDARPALSQREVDFTHASVYNSIGLDDSVAIGIHAEENEWADVTDDAPTVNDALGTDIPNEAADGRYLWVAPPGIDEEYPDRHEMLADALEGALNDEEYIADLEDLNPPEDGKVLHMGPEETFEADEIMYELAEDNYEELGEVMEG
jgi:putative tricarboxylic transport membrane protein